ncbi:hypothetical protein [Arthrobacter gyeryongensis]
MLRLEMGASLTFWRVLRVSIGATLYVVAIMYLSHVVRTGRLELLPDDMEPLGPGETLGALAAVATGTIALQVMAQTAYSKKSETLEEHGHRKVVMLLALMSSTVSFILATIAWLSLGEGSFGRLANVLVVTTLAAMNCFIASDAAGRIHRIDTNNLDIQVSAARKVVSHYRRKRLPPLSGLAVRHWFIAGLLDILAITAVIGTLEAIIMSKFTWGSWVVSYVISAVWAVLVLAAFAVTAASWFKDDVVDRWQASASCLLLIVVAVLTILNVAPHRGVLHILVLLLLPIGLTFASLKTTRMRNRWLLPPWVPGSLVRTHVARRVKAADVEARSELSEIKQRQHRRRPGPTRVPHDANSSFAPLSGTLTPHS